MHGCFYLKERNFPLNSPNLASPVHPQVNKDPEPDGHLDFCHHACLILTVARLKWFVFRNCICECYVLPLPAFLIASEKKHSAIQGKEHPEFLFYAVAVLSLAVEALSLHVFLLASSSEVVWFSYLWNSTGWCREMIFLRKAGGQD